MQKHRKTVLVLVGLLLLSLCIGFVWAKSAAMVGMVIETQGHAYWQNDGKKVRVQELAELSENSKLVLTKGSKLTVVYLASGQQYELNGPSLVQFKNSQPIALSGMLPKTVGAKPVLTEKTKIDPKKVQTAGQTLVSTEQKEDPNLPVDVAAAPPPPPPPPAAAPMPMPSPVAPPVAASSDAEREAAYSASTSAEPMAADTAPVEPPACPPPTSDSSSEVAACGEIKD